MPSSSVVNQLPPLDSFTVVDDFAVSVGDSHHKSGHVEFVSPTRGRLAGFPGWEHAERDLRHFVASDVPLGTLEEPYEELDEAGRILIFEEGNWIYVAEGESPTATTFRSTFRVPRGRYLQAWAALIDMYNPITPLDEPS